MRMRTLMTQNFLILFGSMFTYSYLCNVKDSLLTIQVSFLRGQAVYVTTHFKTALMCGFVFLSLSAKTIHHHFQKSFATCYITFY